MHRIFKTLSSTLVVLLLVSALLVPASADAGEATRPSSPTETAAPVEALEAFRGWYYGAEPFPDATYGDALVAAVEGRTDVAEAYFYIGRMQEMGMLGSSVPAGWYIRRAAEGGHPAAVVRMAQHDLAVSQTPEAVDETLKILRDHLDRGEADAAYSLGLLHHRGLYGVPADPDLAERYYRQAIALGHVRPYGNLAELYKQRGDIDAALAALRAGAEEGDGRVMSTLADLYRDGRFVEQDLAKEIDLRYQAARTREPASLRRYAVMLNEGYGPMDRDADAARRTLDLAVSYGDAEARRLRAVSLLRGGFGYTLDPAEGVRQLRELAERGQKQDAEAMRELAELYVDGLHVGRDLDEARRLLRQAADAGDTAASVRLGELNRAAAPATRPGG